MNSSEPEWVDFHCHLDLYPDHGSLIRECEAHRIATLAVTTTPKAWRRNRELALGSAFVRVGLGFHPQLVAERLREWPLFEQYFSEAEYIGEVGLDAGPAHYRSLSEQEDVFSRVLMLCAKHKGKILSVHSVRSASRVLKLIEDHLPGTSNGVILHWFTGTIAEAQRAAGLGCYFSVNSAMLRSARGRDLVLSLPKKRLLTETDGPFVRENDEPVRPAQVLKTVEGLADLLNRPREEVKSLLVANLLELALRLTQS